MQVEYFDFGIPHPGLDEEMLIYSESKSLLHACIKHPEITVIELRCLDSKSDIIIIERTDETVISRNKVGIKRAKERLALLYNPDLKYPYEVRPLRKDFPRTQHQFDVSSGKPKSLCLYNDAWSTVERTWTPEKHLGRIFWWLKRASEGKLHGKNEPLEQLYYIGKKKILLPPNFHKASPISLLSFEVEKLHGDWYEGKFSIDPETKDESNQIIANTLVLNVDPVITGVILNTPETLGELNEQLKSRGSSLISILKKSILSKIPNTGIEVHSVKKTFIFIKTPIVREQGKKPERTNTMCYVVDVHLASLGLKLGVLLKLPTGNKAYKETKVRGGNPNKKSVKLDDSWKSIKLTSFEVKSRYSADEARIASGFASNEMLDKLQKLASDEKKKTLIKRAKKEINFNGVLAGVGALGSSMAEIWSKQCWGNWTYVDDDTMEPHNVIRHVGKDNSIGYSKSLVVQVITNNNFGDRVQKSKSLKSKINKNSSEINELLSTSDLLIDATTTLDAPRDLSLVEDAPRMASVFITPSGNDSVLLLEDENRLIRLSALEAQYYRAILNNKWGNKHLKRSNGKVTVGAGCRDSSFVMSYEPIQMHSAILAKHVRKKAFKKAPHIQVWASKKNSSIKSYEIDVYPVVTKICGEWKIVWDEGLTEKAKKYRADELPNETGGIILGYSDQKTKTIHVVDLVSAPSDSDGNRTSFLRGVKGMKELRKECNDRTAKIVDYIGDWHSHPEGVSAKKSQKDIVQHEGNQKKMALDGLLALMIIVGEKDISFHIKQESITLSQ